MFLNFNCLPENLHKIFNGGNSGSVLPGLLLNFGMQVKTVKFLFITHQ